MGRKARLRMTRDRQTLLQKRQRKAATIDSDNWENPLKLSKHGYTFLAEWILGDCEIADDIRNKAKVRLTCITDSDWVMPFEIVGKGRGVAFIQHNLTNTDSWFDPIDRTDTTFKAFYHSPKFSDAISEMAGKLLINGKLVTDSPIYFSLQTGQGASTD